MMGIFDELIDELPPLKGYIDHMFDSKLMATVGGSSTEHHLARLRDELFSPESDTHQASDELTLEMGTVASEALLGELRDIKKATSWHLSSLDGELSWGMASDDVHEAGLGKYAVNDPAERSFGLTTRQIQVAGRVDIGNAGATALAEALKVNAMLKKIKVQNNSIGNEAADALRAAAKPDLALEL